MKVVISGAGNVGRHLASDLNERGHENMGVYPGEDGFFYVRDNSQQVTRFYIAPDDLVGLMAARESGDTTTIPFQRFTPSS